MEAKIRSRRNRRTEPEEEDSDVEEKYRQRRRRAGGNNPTTEAEEEEDTSFGTWKTIGVLGIIAACFIILWPKMFYPMVLYALGSGSDNSNEKTQQSRPPFPTAGSPHGRPPVPGFGEEASRGSRPPPPHMGSMPKQTGSTGGGRGGFMSTLLPLYSIGVICFMLYMLSRIFFKNPKKKAKRRRQNSDDEDDEDEDEEASADEGPLGGRSLKSLQNRLTDTESALHRILGQLSNLNDSDVDATTIEAVRAVTNETLSNLNMYESHVDQHETRRNKAVAKQAANKKDNYLKDLEKALTDFRKFTADYVEKHEHGGDETNTELPAESRNHDIEDYASEDPNTKSSSASSNGSMPPEEPKPSNGNRLDISANPDQLKSPAEPDDPVGCDTMEADKHSGDSLTIPEGTGEMITLASDGREFFAEEAEATETLIKKLDKVESLGRQLIDSDLDTSSELRHRHPHPVDSPTSDHHSDDGCPACIHGSEV